MATAADVPNIYDLVIGTRGYIFANTIAPNLPFRTQRARFGFTPTFVTRQNVSGDFGDNQQDFWLTATQRDWEFGQGQKHFKQADTTSAGSFFSGRFLDTRTEGEITTTRAATEFAPGVAVTGAGGDANLGLTWTTSATNLYQVTPAVLQNQGAHGAGGVCRAICSDGSGFLYLSGSSATSVRKFLLGGASSAFCATPMDDLTYLNNTLFGSQKGTLYSISAAGVATAQFSFKDAQGNTFGSSNMLALQAYGGKMLVLKKQGFPGGDELYVWDGGLTISKVMDFPPDFVASDMCVNVGVAYIVGIDKGGDTIRVYGFDGSMFLACEGMGSSSAINEPGIAAYRNGFVASDGLEVSSSTHQVVAFDASTGGCTPVSYWADSSGGPTGRIAIASGGYFVMWVAEGDTSIRTWSYANGTINSSSFVYSSQFDFDSSLRKLLRGVTVDYYKPSGAGTVDVWYQLDDGADSLLAVGVTPGVEATFAAGGVTGRRITIKLVLNTSAGFAPVVRRLFVRAAPIQLGSSSTQMQFRTNEYVLDMSGRNGQTPVQLRNGNSHNLDGQAMLTAFLNDVRATTPLTITDHLGTYTGIADLNNLDVIEVRPEEYLVRVATREI